MKRYSTYKDSGISWLGHIPDHWETKKISELFVERREKVSDKDFPALSVSKAGVTPQLETAVKTDNGDNRKKVCEGDFVVNSRSDRKGSCGISSYTGSVSLINTVLCPRHEINRGYFHFLFRSNNYIEEYYRLGRGIVADLWTTRYSEAKNIYIPFPPTEEQTKIVDFINKKSNAIDLLISERERELKILADLKQSEVAEVVTHGLNPDVPLKDSGIPWIGLIPENWEVCRMKKIFSEAKEKTSEEGGTLLSLSQYTGVTLKEESKKTGMFAAESTIGYNVVHRGQFVMNIMLAWNGSYAVSDYEGIISPSYCVFNFNDKVKCDKKYYHYLLRLQAYAGAFKTMSKGIIESRLRLYPMYFLAFNTILPPIEEQKAIVEYIDEKYRKIDGMMAKINSEIAYLKEYKQRMIADAVTGAICVQ